MSGFRLPRRSGLQADDAIAEELVMDDLDAVEGEFREFLAADDNPPEADPLFRERLRRRLWTMLRDQRRRD